MAGITTINSMRLFRTGACVLGLTLPLVGGSANAKPSWELVTDRNNNVLENIWLKVNQIPVAESDKKEDRQKITPVTVGADQIEVAESDKKEDRQKITPVTVGADQIKVAESDKKEDRQKITPVTVGADQIKVAESDKKEDRQKITPVTVGADQIEVAESDKKEDRQKITPVTVGADQIKVAESDKKEDRQKITPVTVGADHIQVAEANTDQKAKKTSKDSLVLISEVLIEGLENHPDQVRLEYAAYDAMSIRPGSRVSREELKRDLNSIYATGWFSGLEINPKDTPLGVQVLVKVEPNPVFTKVEISPENSLLTPKLIQQIFKSDFGKTLNLNVLRLRINQLKSWYTEAGYSLARISGPNRITPDGIVQLKVQEGTIGDIEIVFLDEEGNTIRENGKPVKGKTKKWVIDRELSSKPGVTFNRNKLEQDIKRLYGLSLFSDIKVTLKPIPGEPGKINIVLGMTEQKTGSLTGGVGYSGSQGMFGSAGFQEKNFLGRSWSSSLNFTYGEYGGLISFSLSDPWIKGDKYRTAFRTSVFISRDLPQEFRSSDGGKILGVKDYYQASGSTAASTVYDIDTIHSGVNTAVFGSVSAAKASKSNYSWFDYEGDSVLLQRTGGSFSFSRPLNGAQPLKRSQWTALLGMDFQQIKPIDYSSQSRPYGAVSKQIIDNKATNGGVICIAYNCADENTLVGARGALTYNNLNDSRNPTSGDYWSLGTEQYVSVGSNSPTFNRARTSYSYFIPTNILKFHKGCRPKSGEKFKCAQTIGFQFKAGTIIGELPPYEAFCLGGSKSVRGWSSCDLGVSRSFGEATAEYRVPIWRMISGNLFLDAGTDFDSQNNVPGNPGELLGKNGTGFSVGSGLSFNTPVGPLRIEAASQDLEGDWRYNIGFGWKF